VSERSTAGALIRTARRRGRLSQAALARRAGMPRSVVNAYERATREPSVLALRRLAVAAGADVELAKAGGVDVDRAARLLEQVLDVAESLPFRRRRTLPYPRFCERIATRGR
jgi:transcriptional regulator with XRE-family HTH domain